MGSTTDGRAFWGLLFLAVVLVLGVIGQVLLQTYQRVPADVNPVLATLAGTAIAALYGHGTFLASARASALQRTDLLGALAPRAGMTNGGPGRPIGGPASTPIPGSSTQ